VLYDSRGDSARHRPSISVDLPQDLLDQNVESDTSLRLRSSGAYGKDEYLLFPVIPRPWGAAAVREQSLELSPSTGISAGGLDWWAHAGPEPGQRSQ
jgi:hypothetical protein